MASPPGQHSSGIAKTCAKCDKSGITLKKCAKCKSALYCNRECQTAHWKTHKKDCSRLASASAPASAPSSASRATTGFNDISTNTFLHGRPEKEVYKVLVDMLRIRQEDTYTFQGDTMSGTIYDGESSSEPAFRQMINRAKRKQGFLPPWWTDAKLEECIRLNRQALQCAQEKSDIQESWGDNMMPMKLRMLGEEIYGNTPGTAPGQGQSMLALQTMLEGGGSGMASSHLDLSGSRRT